MANYTTQEHDSIYIFYQREYIGGEIVEKKKLTINVIKRKKS